MGKSKRKKFGGSKPRPTGLQSVSECEAEFELTGNADSTPGALQNIIEKVCLLKYRKFDYLAYSSRLKQMNFGDM